MDVVCPFVNRGESNQSQKAEKPPNDWGIGCCAVRLSRQNTTQYSTCTCTVLSTVHVLGVPVPVKLGIPRNVSTRLRTLKSELGHTSGIWTFLKFSMQLHPLPPTTYIRYSTVWNFQFLACSVVGTSAIACEKYNCTFHRFCVSSFFDRNKCKKLAIFLYFSFNVNIKKL